MEPVIVSFIYFGYVILLCEAGRQFAERFVRSSDTKTLIIEFFGTLQICACVFENEHIAEHYGTLGFFLAIAIMVAVHIATVKSASANPCPLIENAFYRYSTMSQVIARLACQIAAGYFAFKMAKAFWWLEFSYDHSRSFAQHFCHSDLKAPLLVGIICELLATFVCRLIDMSMKERYPQTWNYIVGFFVAAITLAGLHFTGCYFNPILASARTLGCQGASVYEHFTVYWIGPILGWLLATKAHWMFKKQKIT